MNASVLRKYFLKRLLGIGESSGGRTRSTVRNHGILASDVEGEENLKFKIQNLKLRPR